MNKRKKETPQQQIERLVAEILERDCDPAMVPPYFRVADVSVGWEGPNRRMTIVLRGMTNQGSAT